MVCMSDNLAAIIRGFRFRSLLPPACELWSMCLALAFLSLPGCHLHDVHSFDRVPHVSTRFTQNPLQEETDKAKGRASTIIVSQMKVGLAMQAGPDSVHTRFAGALGTVLVRELQLSPGSMTIQPLTSLQLRTAVPALESAPENSVMTVAFSDSQDALPPALPPNPLFLTTAPPIVDQILVVRVIEYRPYFPFLATLEMRVLDGDIQDVLFTTTASWSGVDYRLAETKTKRTWRKPFLCDDPKCEPSPAHNSPQALMHEMSKDISAWYNACLSSVSSDALKSAKPPKRRWGFSLRKDPCDP
jgi:hypothetical protein